MFDPIDPFAVRRAHIEAKRESRKSVKSSREVLNKLFLKYPWLDKFRGNTPFRERAFELLRRDVEWLRRPENEAILEGQRIQEYLFWVSGEEPETLSEEAKKFLKRAMDQMGLYYWETEKANEVPDVKPFWRFMYKVPSHPHVADIYVHPLIEEAWYNERELGLYALGMEKFFSKVLDLACEPYIRPEDQVFIDKVWSIISRYDPHWVEMYLPAVDDGTISDTKKVWKLMRDEA